MSLINPHTLTEEGRAARRRNGGRSRGAVTPEGKERSRAANLQHGLYSKEKEQALLALGEDPADLADLIAGCYQQWDPTNRQECDLVEQMAQAQWCKRRAARREENLQARHLEKVAADRREKTLQLRYHNQDQTCWLSLAYSYALRPDFYATPGCIARFQQAFAGEMQSRLEAILDLLHRLRAPEHLPAPAATLPPEATTDAGWAEFLAMEAEEDVDEVPRPDIPIAEGEEREGLREVLCRLAQQERESIGAVWEPFFAQYLEPMALAERDEAVMAIEGKLERLRREEESCLRQLWRLTNLLLKMRKEKQEREARNQESGGGRQEQEGGRQKAEGARQRPGDQAERAEVAGQESGVRSQESGDRSQKQGDGTGDPRATEPGRRAGRRDAKGQHDESVEAPSPASQPQGSERPAPTTTSTPGLPRRNIENEGATGDVIENKGGLKTTGAEKAHPDAPNAAPAAPKSRAKSAAGGSMAA